MRSSRRLTQANTSISFQEVFPVVTLQIHNPTGSRVLVRIGGTDIPTTNSADFYVEPLTTVQLPVSSARDFAAAFQNTSILGTQAFPVSVSVITTLGAGEPVGSIGNVQGGLARLEFADRNPVEIALSLEFSGLIGGSPLIFWQYTVPANRKFMVGLITANIHRNARSSAFSDFSSGGAFLFVTYTIAFQSALDILRVRHISNDIGTTFGRYGKYEPKNMVLQPGAVIFSRGTDSVTSGGFTYFSSLVGTEYDA